MFAAPSPFLHDSHVTSEVREGNDGATHKTKTQLAEERDDVIPEARRRKAKPESPFTTTGYIQSSHVSAHKLPTNPAPPPPPLRQFISLSSCEYSNRKSPLDRWHQPPSALMLKSK